MVKFRSEEIIALLRGRPTNSTDPPSEDSEAGTNSSAAAEEGIGLRRECDVSYVMFLEPAEEDDPKWSWPEWVADRAIKAFSPLPTMAHVELIVPPIPDSRGGKVHFATYLGAQGANWQNQGARRSEGVGFYLIENGAKWRALPVFAPAVADTIHAACESNLHSPYSIGMYPTSARPLRKLAWLWGDQPKHMGHCATITTRVLKEAGAGYALPHSSAWYCPSSLYTALSTSLNDRLDDDERASLSTVEPETCNETIETLLRGQLSYKAVRDLGDAKCIDAIRALTLRVCAAADGVDANAGSKAQKDLASALLRWVLLRDDPACPD